METSPSKSSFSLTRSPRISFPKSPPPSSLVVPETIYSTVQIPQYSKASARSEFDIVIYTKEAKHLYRYLVHWKEFFQDFDIIAVVEGDGVVNPRIRDVFHITIYQREDIEKILKEKAGCISKCESAARCFGFMMSKKKFIFTVDVNCLVAMDPAGSEINPIIQHRKNLMFPSTPYVVNPTYDPYETENDFSLGYPHCLREGVPTAISQGLWLNEPHYDVVSQIVKPLDRNLRYVDAVMTIPTGCLYPMSGLNLSFNRELIGPALYFGLMGDNQPLSGYGDVWAGLCSKVICDHLGLGVKTGLPYVWHIRGNREDPAKSYKEDVKWVEWQKTIYSFFQNVKFPSECNAVDKCYTELANQVKEKLGVADQYFADVADGMLAWIEAWYTINHPGEAVADSLVDRAMQLKLLPSE